MEKNSRLGRGLEALLTSGAEEAVASDKVVAEVGVDLIEENPYQPRKTFDPDELASLEQTIRDHGVLQPLVVRLQGDTYQLIAGERRLKAARTAGLQTVPVRIVDFNDQQVLEAALIENIQRSDLNPIEKAQGFKEYLDRFSMTHEDLANRLGLARSTVTNLVALLEMPTEIQNSIRVGQISLGHAKVLKGLADEERQSAIAKQIVARGLSVHGTEALIKQLDAPAEQPVQREQSSGSSSSPQVEKTAHVQSIEDQIRQKLGLKVEIKVRGEDRGHFVLAFESNDDFERLVDVLSK